MIEESSSRRIYGSVDSLAITHNLAVARNCAPNSKVMAVVKTNAYGHGLVPVSKLLDDSIDALAVATVDEALTLRRAQVRSPICVLSGFYSADDLERIVARDISVVVHCVQQIKAIKHSKVFNKVPIWLKVNSGMNRLGFSTNSIGSVFDELDNMDNVDLVGIMSHFACADDVNSNYTLEQTDRFINATKNIPLPRSIANSAGILKWPNSHLDWVRPGIMLYGASPIIGQNASQLGLRPALDLYSTIIAIHKIRKGERIGYGLNWTASGDTVVGIVACGYGDGYLRSASSRAQVLVNGVPANIIGTISMDTMAVDVTDHLEVKTGSAVKLVGAGIPVEDVAACANTIPYEFLCSFNPRTATIDFA